MARNVTTPRFWVNYLQFFEHVNSSIIESEISDTDRQKLSTLPVKVSQFQGDINETDIGYIKFKDYDANILNNPFIAILGIKSLPGEGETVYIETYDENSNTASDFSFNLSTSAVTNNGFAIKSHDSIKGHKEIRIVTMVNDPEMGIYELKQAQVGSIVYGSYYEPPHSPDMALTLNYDFSGIKRQTTRGGNTLTNTMWTSPPKWGDLAAWELEKNAVNSEIVFDQNLAKKGRRSWKLKFSFLAENKLFATSTSLATADNNDFDVETLLNGTGNDLYGKFLMPTMGGTLPFIFSPSNTAEDLANPDNYAIATIKEKSFSFKQVAHNIYDISFTVVETW